MAEDAAMGCTTSWRLLADSEVGWPLSCGLIDVHPVELPIQAEALAWRLIEDVTLDWGICSGRSESWMAVPYDSGPSEPGHRADWAIGTNVSWPVTQNGEQPQPQTPPPASDGSDSSDGRLRYRTWLPARAPGWLQGPNGKAWLWAHGDVLDSFEEAARIAVKARFPAHTTQDGLNILGAERGLERVSGETAEAFAERVVLAWTAWQNCGTPLGILSALRIAGIQNAQIRPENGLIYRLDASGALAVERAFSALQNGENAPADGPLLDGDGLPLFPQWTMRGAPFWSEFELLIPAAGGPWTDEQTGKVTPPGEASPEAERIKRLVRKWKGTHCRCAGIVIQLDERAPLVGFPQRTVGTLQADGQAIGGLWTPNASWFDLDGDTACEKWTLNVQ